MDADLLHKAATQAKTRWLEKSLTLLLPQIWQLTIETPHWEAMASAWASQIDQLFQAQKLTTPGQQKNRRTDIANALRVIHPQHPAIPFVLLPTEVYIALNHAQAKQLNDRTNKFFSAQQANELVDRAIALLDRHNPDDVAAGLSVLVGRRISEILVSRFQPKTAFSLWFSEPAKRRGARGLTFEIPTLAEADRVLRAIEHLKQVWNIGDLQALGLPPNHLKRKINARYTSVPRACRQHFADLVPGREANNDPGERLYTHLFRAVYAEIATYYYKPEWIPDHRFKAEIQGHFKLTADGQKISNYAARQNYDDYLIRDRLPDQSGVKLGLPGVTVLDVFQQERTSMSDGDREPEFEQATNPTYLGKGTINALLYRAVDRLLFSKQWPEALAGLLMMTGRTVAGLLSASPAPKTQFSIRVGDLEIPTLTTATQVIAAWNKFRQMPPPPLPAVEEDIQTICQQTFNDLAPIQGVSDLRAVYSAISLHWFCPDEIEPGLFLQAIDAAEPHLFQTENPDRGIKLAQRNVQVLERFKPRETIPSTAAVLPIKDTLSEPPLSRLRHRRKTLVVDADLLRTVAAAFGIEIRGKGGTVGLSYEAALAQLLNHLAEHHQDYNPPTTQSPSKQPGSALAIAVTDQAKTLAWFTGRIEALEQEVETLKKERADLMAQVGQPPLFELEQLQQENQRLKLERDQATTKLEAFRRLLNGNEDPPEQGQSEQAAPIEAVTHLPITSPDKPQPEASSAESIRVRKRQAENQVLDNIRQAVRAMMALNDQDGRALNDKWYISFPAIQTLLRAHGMSANQKLVAQVFEEMKAELEHHHDRHGMGSRHNRRHPDLTKIVQQINLKPLLNAALADS
ncbi:hypothetical protein BST81_03470 [Leptolyngbya sp. 'hensonii']|uniref:protelomerase family protein n=1 Tax=Leptolyngbya sp. 'hensonii' TaxID=1922337 RepID=UPI00094F88BA|nr:protelomerase family protein [Leptolyngbya sp. 'hensonii']OLP19846.1 hypothetical protein BST81_03470 [Leptolyngbya sp. 'hensonii']